jgi:hypothetical protein
MIFKFKIINKQTETQNGFIALMSAIIISAILLGFAVTSGASSFHSRFNTLDSELKRISLSLAESCVNVALLKITQNYDYGNVGAGYSWPINGEIVPVGSDTCTIDSMEHEAENITTHQKKVTIIASGEYNGAHSTIVTEADVANPTHTVVPAPTCSFTASPLSITQGASTTLQWNLAGNFTNFSIDRDIGGSHTVYSNPLGNSLTNSPSASATYTATISGPGGTSQCESPRSVVVQPPPSCADTVIMLDRRAFHNLLQIYSAITGLLDLYDNLSPAPKVGIGSFGPYPNTSPGLASIPNSPSGHLTNIFGMIGTPGTGLYKTAYDLTRARNSNGQLTAGINSGNTELLGVTPSIPKVLVIMADGNHTETNSTVLSASDNVKISGTEIFTIVIDATSTNLANRSLMAEMSTGNVPVLGHQNGSQNDAGTSTDPATISTENNDGDNFFISPTNTELPVLLQTIGEKVCPAAIPSPPPAPIVTPPPPAPPSGIDIGSWQEL